MGTRNAGSCVLVKEGGEITMEDMLLLLSLEDFFALLALFAGCCTSVYYLRQCLHPQTTMAVKWHPSDTYRPSINRCLVESYPMAARQPLRTCLLRRMQQVNSDSDTYSHLVW